MRFKVKAIESRFSCHTTGTNKVCQEIQGCQFMNCATVGKTMREKHVICWCNHSAEIFFITKCMDFIKAVLNNVSCFIACLLFV
jgi:hypothetical protein